MTVRFVMREAMLEARLGAGAAAALGGGAGGGLATGRSAASDASLGGWGGAGGAGAGGAGDDAAAPPPGKAGELVVVDIDTILDVAIGILINRRAQVGDTLRRLFTEGDDNGDGVLSYDEFKAIIRRASPPGDDGRPVSDRKVLRIFRDALERCKGSLSLSRETFVGVCMDHGVMPLVGTHALDRAQRLAWRAAQARHAEEARARAERDKALRKTFLAAKRQAAKEEDRARGEQETAITEFTERVAGRAQQLKHFASPAPDTGEVDIGQLVAVANAMLGDVDVWQQRMKKQAKKMQKSRLRIAKKKEEQERGKKREEEQQGEEEPREQQQDEGGGHQPDAW